MPSGTGTTPKSAPGDSPGIPHRRCLAGQQADGKSPGVVYADHCRVVMLILDVRSQQPDGGTHGHEEHQTLVFVEKPLNQRADGQVKSLIALARNMPSTLQKNSLFPSQPRKGQRQLRAFFRNSYQGR